MKVLFYPNRVVSFSRIRTIFKVIDWEIIEDISKEFDVVFYWNIETINKPDKVILKLSESYPIVNLRCNDVSKSNVTKIYQEVFGNVLEINPEKYKGRVVAKKNLTQGDKDGKIIECPCKKEEGWHYQKLLQDTQTGLIHEIRAYIVGSVIAVNEKEKNINNRFVTIVEKNDYRSLNELFSDEEIKKINKFCDRIGAEYAELDILRDKELYIIDVNNISGIGTFEYHYKDIYNKTNEKIGEALRELIGKKYNS